MISYVTVDEIPSFADRCRAESTRDVVFLLQSRVSLKREWYTESVWLSREECEAFIDSHRYRWKFVQCYGIPAEGFLAMLIREFPKGGAA